MGTMLVCLVAAFGKAFIKVFVMFGLAIVIEDAVRKIIQKRRTSKGNGV